MSPLDAHHPVLFLLDTKRSWANVPPLNRWSQLQGHARSCGYQFATALTARSSCPSPQLPHGQQMGIPGFPLPLVGTMPVDLLPLAGCSRASWFSKPFEHAGPHFHLSNFCRCSLIPVHRAAYPKFHRVLGQPRPVVTLTRPYLYGCHLAWAGRSNLCRVSGPLARTCLEPGQGCEVPGKIYCCYIFLTHSSFRLTINCRPSVNPLGHTRLGTPRCGCSSSVLPSL